MYTPGPTTEELELIGIKPEDVQQETMIEVWPDNWDAVVLFQRLSTQWYHGFNGPTGMNYNVIQRVARMIGLVVKDWPDFFGQIQTLEHAALAQIRENQERHRSK
jgi:hypothetical protein